MEAALFVGDSIDGQGGFTGDVFTLQAREISFPCKMKQIHAGRKHSASISGLFDLYISFFKVTH